MAFTVNQEFHSFEEVLEAKKDYEKTNNVVLVRRNAHFLKGEGEILKRLIYSRLCLECKAGKERPCESKGIRKSSTFKKNCPMKINIVFKKDVLKVSSINLVHSNHQQNLQTFIHYPENVRLPDEEKKNVETAIACDGKKFKIKNLLMESRKDKGNQAPVLLKSIHNLQTTKRLEKEKLIPGENLLEKLLSSMLKVPGAKVRVLRDENNELCCIFFQDPRMATMFDKYPELLLFDATYKMNDLELPLFVQSCVDGNGITEIVTLAICKSESRVVIEFILDCFKEVNPSWTKIKCVIGDKDFADRIVYQEKFTGVAMQICLFHVLRTFNREISAKRGITKEQRQKALAILQRLCYASSEEFYEEEYAKLCQLNIESVMLYYNTNWHTIRTEWTLCGRNKYSNYLNNTNNRSETMNQKIKMVGTRNANLLTFFENVSTSVSVLASEKDAKALRHDMRTERVRCDDVNLLSYYEFLTPFIFSKIQLEFKKMELVNFYSYEENTGITISGRAVTSEKCSCDFHLSMKLPCRHILRFRKDNGMELFAPALCAARWRNEYYKASHPALQNNVPIALPMPIYVQIIRVPEEKDKYKAAASITREINTLVSTMSTGQYTFYLDKLKTLKNKIITPDTEESGLSFQGVINSTSNPEVTESDVALDALDLSVPKSRSNICEDIHTIFELNRNDSNQSTVTGSSPMESNGTSHLDKAGSSPIELNCPSPLEINDPCDMEMNGPSLMDVNESRLVIVAPTSKDILQIKLPFKHKSVGRPKGSTNTVIGTQRMKIIRKFKANSAFIQSEGIIHPKRSERIRISTEINSGVQRKKARA